MDASTRLYARLGEIPEDPNDPESLEDLIVCAFGAFERYYLCWRTKGGEYRQDGYDLPPALNEWLNPTDDTTRDWASLQVVFGRGEEYFASDKYGKLEFKEPEVKKSAEEEKEKVDRQALRRSRAVSFLRPLSQASTRSDIPASETPPLNRRTSSISSQRASRPPSLSYSTTGSEASMVQPSEPQTQDSASAAQPSFFSRLASAVPSTVTSKAVIPAPATGLMQIEPISTTTSIAVVGMTHSTRDPMSASNQLEPSNRDLNRSGIASIPEERFEPKSMKTSTPEQCTCGCHEVPLSYVKRLAYVNASVQTDPISPPLRTSLRVDTLSASNWDKNNSNAVSQDVQTPIIENSFCAAPFSMGRMTNYFSKPGYQLGDSLAGGYHYYEQPVYLYQDEFGEEALR